MGMNGVNMHMIAIPLVQQHKGKIHALEQPASNSQKIRDKLETLNLQFKHTKLLSEREKDIRVQISQGLL
jgi:tRNA A22 N-methylase